jgi:hypothetical protein
MVINMALINPSIEQAEYQSWEDNFIVLAQNNRSMLSQTQAVRDFSFTGSRHNFVRVGTTELETVTGRNPTVTRREMLFDNRQCVKMPFYKSFIVDQKDVREMLKDPKNEIYTQILNALNRAKDKFIVDSAIGNVNVGDPNSGTPLTVLTPEQDGVVFIDATQGLNYEIITSILTTMINNSVCIGDMQNTGLTLAHSGTEWEALVNEDKFINNLYTAIRPVDNGYINRIFGMQSIAYPGSKTGTIEVPNPILPEDIDTSTRQCVLFSPDSVRFTIDNIKFKYTTDLEGYVRSDELKFYCEMSAIRTEGCRVAVIETTF